MNTYSRMPFLYHVIGHVIGHVTGHVIIDGWITCQISKEKFFKSEKTLLEPHQSEILRVLYLTLNYISLKLNKIK